MSALATESTAPLAQLAAHGILDERQHADLSSKAPPPAWLNILQAFAAWIASIFILGSFLSPLMWGGNSGLAQGIGAALLIGAALALFRKKDGTFFTQVALAFSLAGQALLVNALTGDRLFFFNHDDAFLYCALFVSAAMAVPRATPLHRAVCTLLALACLTWLIGPGQAQEAFGVLLAAAASALWLRRRDWAAHRHAPYWQALAHATTVLSFAVAWLLGTRSSARFGFSIDDLLGDGQASLTLLDALPLSLYTLGAVAVLAGTTVWLSRALAPPRRAALVGCAIVLGLVAHSAPGLLICTAMALATYHACQRVWFALSLACAVLLLGEFYYSLHVSLLMKSAALGASGCLLLCLRLALRGWQRKAS